MTGLCATTTSRTAASALALVGGSAGNPKCKKGPNKRGPTKFHHFCYINYFKQKKKHTFVDAFDGVVCFQCKMPAKKRGA